MRNIQLNDIEAFSRQQLYNEKSGHDWFHIERVRKNALLLLEGETGANSAVIEAAALLHEAFDTKLDVHRRSTSGEIFNLLTACGFSAGEGTDILHIIENLSFKGGRERPSLSFEGEIVQDADRLDALGAIGIARAFTYSGWKGQDLFDPELKVREEMSEREYREGESTAINHFYEKLLKLPALMNTDRGRKIAQSRVKVMENFLDEFFLEWKGIK
ncbi:phosphohydrolase [Bacillus lacus]|uniref:Phosphohydrolase n=1 Tax=Metabacillus lacus TaxID=1983721 RepID=A0A7X2LYI2_9BACI|nr:HD domain-containing protein [Metabacillus lacus]MRX70912.1 phosphohydrolase [Metabacillus lacus]